MNKKIKNYTTIISSIVAILASLWAFIEVASFAKFEIFREIGISVASAILIFYVFEFFIKKSNTIFVVYSHEDKKTVALLIEELKDKNYQVLSDEELIKPGDNINEKISEAISKSNKFILVLSPNSINSKWVSIEMKKILETKKIVVPVIIDKIDEVPNYLQDIKYSDLSSNDKKELFSFKSDLADFVKSLN